MWLVASRWRGENGRSVGWAGGGSLSCEIPTRRDALVPRAHEAQERPKPTLAAVFGVGQAR